MLSQANHPVRKLLLWIVIFAVLLAACNGQETAQPSVTSGVAPETVAREETVEKGEPGASAPSANVTPEPAAPTEVAPATRSPQAEVETPLPRAEVKLESPVVDPGANLTERRSIYETAKPFADLVKPHFFATTPEGNPVQVQGEAEMVTEIRGKVKIRLSSDGSHSYLDLLALESELIGEHPVHKVYRLAEMGVPIADGLTARLASGQLLNLFTSVEFEYQRRRFSSGVVTEVFPDGTFLVIPDELPTEWHSNDERVASPTHLHLNSRAFSGGSSPLAREYELEILSLPFDDQRYPPAPLARKQCDVYRESLAATDYMGILDSVGFRFTPAHSLKDLGEGLKFEDRINALLWESSGAGVQYYGFEGWWIADVFRGEEVSWLGECDTAGSLRRYPGDGDDAGRRYLIIRRSLEPDKKQRYRILEVNSTGEATHLYTAPGIILMALPLPYDDRTWLMSTEGWTPAEGDSPPDPRWQAVYAVSLDTPDEYAKVKYPIDRFPRAPEAGLYGASARMSQDGNFLLNTLYGFTDEGGGIWVVDVSGDDFLTQQTRFARIVSWDHTLSWLPLGRLDADPAAMYLFMTGKEVADDFAMTANLLRVREAGLESSIEESRRLLQMVGWNPVPFGWQKLSDASYRMLVETHYNYESSLMPRAKGVYIIPVKLMEE